MAGPFISLYSLSRSQNIRIGSSQGGVTGLGKLFTPTGVSATLVSGGSLTSSQAYFYKVTAITANPAGETLPSAEVTATATGGTLSITVAWSAVAGAQGYNIYRSLTTGTEVFLTSVSGTTLSYTDTGAVTAGTATPPASNTTVTAGRLVPQLYQNPSTAPLPFPLVVDLSDGVARRDVGHHIAEGNLVEVSGVRFTVSGPASNQVLTSVTAETVIATLPLPQNVMNVGSGVRWMAQGIISGTSPTVLFKMRVGPTGSVSDTQIVATAAASVGTGNGWEFNGLWNVQAVGSGTNGKVVGNAQTAGHNASPQITNNTAQASIDTTLPQYATLTVTPGGTTPTTTVTNYMAEFIQQSPTFPC